MQFPPVMRSILVVGVAVVAVILATGCDTSNAPSPTPLIVATATASSPLSQATLAIPTVANVQTGACATSKPFTQTFTTGKQAVTTLHFSQQGCEVRITAAEIIIGKGYKHVAVFDPPFVAAKLEHSEGTPENWSGQGSFKGETSLEAGDTGADTLFFTQQGTYSATVSIRAAERVGGEVKQWAKDATASSELDESHLVKQATGSPNAVGGISSKNAWAPEDSDSATEWVELTYTKTVVPTAINIRETFGPGYITKVEAFDADTSNWVTLWQGKDSTTEPGTFSPPLQKGPETNRIRLTIDTRIPDSNELDAVQLVGHPAAQGWILWMRGWWVEEGNATVCNADGCEDQVWTGQPVREWSWAFNTTTGAVAQTPEGVR